MTRALRSLLFLTVLLGSLLAHGPKTFAASAPNAELESVLRKIESRHYRWVAIRADVLLFFAKAGNPGAMCGGELLYQRLDERMFLSCVDTRKELVFLFRTLDRRFDLYLPAKNTVYHGSIFDMEDSPDIESHLKARDLYRALKPMAVDPRRTKVERVNSAITSLDVYGPQGAEDILVRKLYLTPEGDVRGEIFYDAHGHPVTEVQRYDFQELRGHVGSFDSVIFPKKITIVSPETQKGSAIFFTKVRALDTIDPLEFILRVPYGTKEVFLNEKDPRFKYFKISESDSRLISKAAKKAPQEIPQTPLQKKMAPPKIAEPVSAPAPKPVETKPPATADADISPEGNSSASPSSATNAQTTLDPSVEPSV
jgi:hypothetical protein